MNVEQPNFYSDVCKILLVLLSIFNVLFVVSSILGLFSGMFGVGELLLSIAFWFLLGWFWTALFKRAWPVKYAELMAKREADKAARAEGAERV